MRFKRALFLISLLFFTLACSGFGAAMRQIGEEPIKGALPYSAIAGTWNVGKPAYLTVLFNTDGTYKMSGKCNGVGTWDVMDGKFTFHPSPCKWASGWYVAKAGDDYVIYGGIDEEPDNDPYWDKIGPPDH